MAQVTPFPLWPPEIRNAICEWMFKPGKTWFLEPNFQRKGTVRKVDSVVYAEAVPILYHQNIFRTEQIYTWHVERWLKRRKRSRNLPIKIVIDLRGTGVFMDISIEPIHSAMWMQPRLNVQFRFADSGTSGETRKTRHLTPAKPLNNMPSAMIPTTTAPGLKAIVSSQQSRSSAEMSRNSTDGGLIEFTLCTLSHKTLTMVYWEPTLCFELSPSGYL